jgi:predicted aconitase with swiveling domain
MSRIFKCHPGIGNKVEGIVLCANDNFSARYDLDRINGIFSRPQHKLFGQTYKNKILVLNESKGGVASAWMLYEMKIRDVVPKAILFNRANTILAQGAALADLPMCDRFEDGDITSLLSTGDKVIVDPVTGKVEVI